MSLAAIKGNEVNIRSTPSTKQPPVATLKGGDQLNLIEEQGAWLNVNFFDTAGNEQEGWVYKYLVEGYVKPVKPVVTTERLEAPGEASPPPETQSGVESPESQPATEASPEKADISIL